MRNGSDIHSFACPPRKTIPITNVIQIHRRMPARSPLRRRFTACCIVKLEATRMAVKNVRYRSTWISGGAHGWFSARSVKYVANSEAKNISSEPRNSTIPATRSGTGRPRSECRAAAVGTAGAVGAELTLSAYDRSACTNLRTRRTDGGIAFRLSRAREACVSGRVAIVAGQGSASARRSVLMSENKWLDEVAAALGVEPLGRTQVGEILKVS